MKGEAKGKKKKVKMELVDIFDSIERIKGSSPLSLYISRRWALLSKNL